MKPVLLGIGLLTLGAMAGGQDILACGDKYLIPGRGVNYQQSYKAKVPGSIVIFAPAAPAAPTRCGAPSFKPPCARSAIV